MKTSKTNKSINNIGVIIIIFLCLIVSITLIINFTLNNFSIPKYFTIIEKEQVVTKTEQSMKIFQLKIKELARVVQDYAFWDENYAKVQEDNVDETWYKENFTEWLPEKYGIDLIVVLNKNKKILQSMD